jgi:hypothetical protein
MTETALQNRIRLAVGRLPHVRLWRNNVGAAWLGEVVRQDEETVTLLRPRRVVYGLCEGSSDLIGATQVIITPDLVGKAVAVFTAAEVKRPKGVSSEEQRNFIRFVRGFGGIADVVRSPEDALHLVRSPR